MCIVKERIVPEAGLYFTWVSYAADLAQQFVLQSLEAKSIRLSPGG